MESVATRTLASVVQDWPLTRPSWPVEVQAWLTRIVCRSLALNSDFTGGRNRGVCYKDWPHSRASLCRSILLLFPVWLSLLEASGSVRT